MQILSQILTPYTHPRNKICLRGCIPHKTLPFSRTPFRLATKKTWSSFLDSRGNLRARKDKPGVVSAVDEGSLGTVQRKRKVVEHISLVKAKEDLSEKQEKDMLDFLYTMQYQMRGIVAISLGNISDHNPEQYTHAITMRFQTKEDLDKFYKNPSYTGVLKEHVMPYCHGFIDFDYESEVEDDILQIFRKGEEFNFGVEFILLVSFTMSSLDGPAEDALNSLADLIIEFPSLVVQATKGSNVSKSNMEYTHGAVLRFRSSEAFNIFINSSEYNNMWKSKFDPIIQKALCVHFSVDPIGTELM